jgi:hypothetical protein
MTRAAGILGAVLGLVLAGGCKKGGVALELDMEPQAVTADEAVHFSGQVRGEEPSLTLDGAQVPLQEGRFQAVQPLKPGDNAFTFVLSAKPVAGAAPEQKTQRFAVKRVDPATFDAEHFYEGIGNMDSLQRSTSGGLLADKATVKLKTQELKGVCFEEYGHENRPVTGGMPMDIRLSVGEGRAKVSVKPEQGPVASAVASPGQPATLNAKAALHIRTYLVRLEALDGRPAKDVELVVSY